MRALRRTPRRRPVNIAWSSHEILQHRVEYNIEYGMAGQLVVR